MRWWVRSSLHASGNCPMQFSLTLSASTANGLWKIQDGPEELKYIVYIVNRPWSRSSQYLLQFMHVDQCVVTGRRKLQTDYKTRTINPGSHNGFDRLLIWLRFKRIICSRCESHGNPASSYNLFIVMLSFVGWRGSVSSVRCLPIAAVACNHRPPTDVNPPASK